MIVLFNSYKLRLRIQSGIYPSGFPTKILFPFLLSPVPVIHLDHFNIFDLIKRKTCFEVYKSCMLHMVSTLD